MSDLAIPGAAYAHASWGRWVACCPAPYCRSALQLPRFHPVYRCWECGTRADVVWPSNIEDIERLLMMRPDPITRNWFPGETLHDLLAENLEHGVLPATPAELESAGTGAVLTVVGDRIVCDMFAVTAPRRPAIGGQ